MSTYKDGTGMHVPDARDREIAGRYFLPFLKFCSGASNGLELACGQGYFLEQIKQAGGEFCGVELDSSLCQILRERGLKVEEENFFSYLSSCNIDSHDACMASHIIEHFDTADVRRLFAAVFKVMTPGANFVIITPNIANIRRAVGDFWRDPTHVRPYPISAMSKLLKMEGWEIIDSGEHTDRKPSLLRKIKYAIRNALIGKHWVGDDVYVVARKPVVK